EVGLHGDHATANVDADGVGHDGVPRLEGAADGRPEAVVGIRHQRQITVENGHAADPLRLLLGGGVDDGRPGLDDALAVFVFGLKYADHSVLWAGLNPAPTGGASALPPS